MLEAAFVDPRIEAHSLLKVATDTPRLALEQGEQLLARLDLSDAPSRAVALRAMSVAARLAADNTRSISYAQLALVEANRTGDRALVGDVSLTLAGSLALAGDNERALEILDELSASASGLFAAEVEFQRGAVLSRMGELVRAIDSYSAALPIFRSHQDQASVAMTLHNSGLAHLHRGDLPEARRQLEEAINLETLIGNSIWKASAIHNLGMAAARGGDVPEALRLFSDAEAQHLALTGSAAEIQVGHCEVLLSAGLFREALALATQITTNLHEAGLGEDEAEAYLVGAQAALLADEVDRALRWADIAAELFEQQSRLVWAANARLVGIQAQVQARVINPALITEAREIASLLETEGHVIPAFNARLTSGRIGLELGLVEEAIGDLERVAEERIGPVEMKVQSWLATALIRQATGDPTGADVAARAGMRLLDDYQAALGATDIRTGVERHGKELGDLGLRLALESSNPRRVFGWMERTRARALRHRPVTPSDDLAQAVDLAELRRVSLGLRTALGHEIQELSRQERALQEAIRNRVRATRGQKAMAKAVPTEIARTVEKRTLIEFASIDDQLWAVTIHDNRFSLAPLGLESGVLSELESLRFTMRRLARGRGNASNDVARVVASRLDELLFSAVDVGDGPLVVIPTPALHGTPWAILPSCRGRSVTVAPSAELWWRASKRRRRAGPVLVAAGPDLLHAEREAEEVGALYADTTILGPGASTVDQVKQALDHASTGHIASHAKFEVDNPMFSSLHLADGDLTVYDLERIPRVPSLVVLSACDSGFSDTHAGEELMGLGSALISLGTRSLVASVGLVPDSDATRELMIGFHHGLNARLGPAEALSQAQVMIDHTTAGYVAAASFVCIGAG